MNQVEEITHEEYWAIEALEKGTTFAILDTSDLDTYNLRSSDKAQVKWYPAKFIQYVSQNGIWLARVRVYRPHDEYILQCYKSTDEYRDVKLGAILGTLKHIYRPHKYNNHTYIYGTNDRLCLKQQVIQEVQEVAAKRYHELVNAAQKVDQAATHKRKSKGKKRPADSNDSSSEWLLCNNRQNKKQKKELDADVYHGAYMLLSKIMFSA